MIPVSANLPSHQQPTKVRTTALNRSLASQPGAAAVDRTERQPFAGIFSQVFSGSVSPREAGAAAHRRGSGTARGADGAVQLLPVLGEEGRPGWQEAARLAARGEE